MRSLDGPSQQREARLAGRLPCTQAVLIVNPELHAPALSQFADGGGPIVPGKLFPFMFITIACGAISGFHSLVASGTTPKMLDCPNYNQCIYSYYRYFL